MKRKMHYDYIIKKMLTNKPSYNNKFLIHKADKTT